MQVYVRVCPCVRARTRIVGTALGPVSPVLQSMAGTKPQGQGVNDISLSLLLYVSLSPGFISAALSKILLCKYEKYRNAMFFSYQSGPLGFEFCGVTQDNERFWCHGVKTEQIAWWVGLTLMTQRTLEGALICAESRSRTALFVFLLARLATFRLN